MTAATLTGCPGSVATSPWSSPEARLILRADAPRDQWLAARRSGIGSSDASAVIGVNRYTSPYEVWAEKRGLLPPDTGSDATELGNLLEPIIVARWSEKSGVPIRKAGLMANRERPWQLASVDRLAACGGLVEAKSLSWRVAEEWEDGQTPDHAEAQSQHQMAVTGRGHVHVVGLQDGRTWLDRIVVRDDDLIADMTKLEAELWQMVVDGIEPPIDGSAATTEALKNRWPGAGGRVIGGARLAELLEWRRQDRAHLEDVEARLAEIDNHIRALFGDATEAFITEPDDDRDKPDATWRRNGQFSAKQFAQLYPALAAELTVPVTSLVLDVDRVKTDHPEAYTACRARVLRVAKPKKETKTDG